MELREYADKLAAVLAPFSANTAERLAQLQSAALETENSISSILIDVFVDQDGEGPFEVWARFEGGSAFALDRKFDEDRHLFGVEWREDGWLPDVPARPRDWTRDDLEGAVLDAVTDWITPLIPEGSPENLWQIGATV